MAIDEVDGRGPAPASMSWRHEWPTWPDASSQFADLPFERSLDIVGVTYLNDTVRHVRGTGCDTFYTSRSQHGALYSTWTDGGLNASDVKLGRAVCKPSALCSSSCGPCGGAHGGTNNGSFVQQGWARAALADGNASPAEGTVSPAIIDAGVFNGSSALPYQGRYPSASLFFRGVWYYGTYALAELWGSKQWPCKNWCVLGPFVGFRYSRDNGRTWVEPRRQMSYDFDSFLPSSNLFGESGPVCEGGINRTTPRPGEPCTQFMNPHDCSPHSCLGKWSGKVKFGAPHIVDLGVELEHSPDGRAYLIGHGASAEWQPQSWMQGSEVYLARTKRPPAEPNVMLDPAQWEFFAGHEDAAGGRGVAKWSGSIGQAAPLFAWENKTGVVTMSYAAAIRKYLMIVGTPTERSGVGSMSGTFDTYILESDAITGPFRIVSYLQAFGPQAYFVNLPTFAMGDAPADGYLDARLSYSSNFGLRDKALVPHPKGSSYAWNLLPVRLLLASGAHVDALSE